MNKKKIMKYIVLAVVLLIPIMYSFFYLKAYWDPYGNLQDVKIAMVNLDEEKEDNQGQKLVDRMIENGTFKICEVSEEEAQEGLVNGEYYATITIPKTFTKDLNSASEENKQVSTITYSPNQKTNFLASQIINSAIKTMELNLHSQVAKTVTENLDEKLNDVPQSLETISDGAGEIKSGANQLDSGAQELESGTQSLDAGMDTANQGAIALSQGATTLDQGANQLYTGASTAAAGANQIQQYLLALVTGIQKIEEGYVPLDSGIKEVVGNLNALKTKVNSLSSQTSQLPTLKQQTDAAISTIDTKNNEILTNYNTYFASYLQGTSLANVTDAQIQSVATAMTTKYDATVGSTYAALLKTFRNTYVGNLNTKKLLQANSESLKLTISLLQSEDLNKLLSTETTTKLAKLEAGSTQMTQTLKDLEQKVTQIYGGSKELSNGITSLKKGSRDLASGTNSLSTGAQTLAQGTQELKNGSSKLLTGVNTLKTGTESLNSGVTIFKDEIDNGLVTTKAELTKLNGLEKFAENPVDIQEEAYGEISQYGLSFTPLFLSIGLWVGALMAYVVLYYDQDRRYKLLGRYADNKFLQIALYFGIAIIQGIVTGFLLKLGLGLTPTSTALYYFTCIFISITFMSIIQFLIMNFGDIGKFLALVELVLQLAAAGGTFPIQTVDKAFQCLNPILPMTYAIKLVKEAVVMQDAGFALKNIGILTLYTVIPLLITLGVQWFKKQKQSENENSKKA